MMPSINVPVVETLAVAVKVAPEKVLVTSRVKPLSARFEVPSKPDGKMLGELASNLSETFGQVAAADGA
jgi:hypothetical protein